MEPQATTRKLIFHLAKQRLAKSFLSPTAGALVFMAVRQEMTVAVEVAAEAQAVQVPLVLLMVGETAETLPFKAQRKVIHWLVVVLRAVTPILKRLTVPNMAAAAVALAVVLQQTVVALVYLVQAEVVVDNRVVAVARTAVHGVSMAPQPVYTEVMGAQEQLLEPQGRVEPLVVGMEAVAAVLELEELLAVQVVQVVRQAVAAEVAADEVMAEVVTVAQAD